LSHCFRYSRRRRVRGNAPSGGVGTSTQPAPASSLVTSPISPVQTTPTPALPQPNPQPTSPQTTQNPLPSHSTPLHTSPIPIAAIPLATVRTSPLPTPLSKNKGVVIVPSDEDEDSAEDPVFKRRRTTTVAVSHSSSEKNAESLRDHPPSASTPPNYLALEEGAETTPEPTPTPAPELPWVVQHVLRGYQQETLGSSVDEALMEGM